MIEFKFEFKADRNYLHGTDIFNKISDALIDEYILDISFRSTTNLQCFLSKDKKNKVIAIIKTQFRTLYLIESDKLISERYDFDEDELVSCSVIKENKISMYIDHNYSYVENIVALTKKLNNTLDKPSVGKWLFGQYKSDSDNRSYTGIVEIESNKRIKSRFSENLIYLDGELKVKIMFITGEV